MRKSTFLITLFTCSLAIGGAFGDARTDIQGHYDQVAKMILARDAAGFKKVLTGRVTSDFTAVQRGTRMTFDQMCEGMKAGLGTFQKVTSCGAKLLELKTSKHTAKGKTKHTMAGIMTGPDNKPHKMTYSAMTADEFRMEGGKWKMSKMTWSNEKYTLDGKPFDPSKMAPGGPQPIKK